MSGDANKAHVIGHSDTWVGLSLILVGASAAWMATGFDAISRSYPMVLGLLLVVFGAVSIAKVMLHRASHVSFGLPMRAAFIATLIILLWIGAISAGFGYLLPTFAMQFCFLLGCGVRRPDKAAAISVLIGVASYLAFILGLGVRMPESLLPWLL